MGSDSIGLATVLQYVSRPDQSSLTPLISTALRGVLSAAFWILRPALFLWGLQAGRATA